MVLQRESVAGSVAWVWTDCLEHQGATKLPRWKYLSQGQGHTWLLSQEFIGTWTAGEGLELDFRSFHCPPLCLHPPPPPSPRSCTSLRAQGEDTLSALHPAGLLPSSNLHVPPLPTLSFSNQTQIPVSFPIADISSGFCNRQPPAFSLFCPQAPAHQAQWVPKLQDCQDKCGSFSQVLKVTSAFIERIPAEPVCPGSFFLKQTPQGRHLSGSSPRPMAAPLHSHLHN